MSWEKRSDAGYRHFRRFGASGEGLVRSTISHRTPTKQASAHEKLLESVFDLYGSLAFSLALRILGESQPAEEVVLESFVSLSRCVRKLDHDPPGTELRSLLMRTVHQHSIDRLRNTAGRAQTTMSKLPLMDKGGEDVFQKLTPEIVRNALAQLSPEHRSAIDQAFYGCYSTAEIAGQFGIATGTVNGWLRLGLNGLRSSFLALGAC
jgi:RNA polymerase sigma-70 factor (ECF subfamily)